MKKVKASVFKARCLGLMDEVANSGEEIVVTKNGKPVSRLVPIKTRPKKLFGFHKEDWHPIEPDAIGARGSLKKS
mgnify:FL=1